MGVLFQLLAKNSSASIKKLGDTFGRTVLHYVLCQEVCESTGDASEMLSSIEKISNPSHKDCQSDTALHIAAASHGLETLAKVANMKGADVTVANRRGLSPLDVAAIRGNVKIFNAIVQLYKGKTI